MIQQKAIEEITPQWLNFFHMINPIQAPSVLWNTSSNSERPLPVKYWVASINTENASAVRNMLPSFRNFWCRQGNKNPIGISMRILHPICCVQQSFLFVVRSSRSSQKGVSIALRSPHCLSISVSHRTINMYIKNTAMSSFLRLLNILIS